MIKAIETVYKGYRFRSRLEARWAVNFDALTNEMATKEHWRKDKTGPLMLAGLLTNGFDFSWEYEKEGFELNGIWYLPDFYFKFGAWAEIKPEQFTNEQVDLCIELAKQTRMNCFMLSGVPDSKFYPVAIPSGDVIQCSWLRSHHAYIVARSARFEHGESPVGNAPNSNL